jgi:undecaprenyl-diphosphatase
VSPLDALILGIVQGLTEFLPVSSSGHLVLGQALLAVDVSGIAFEVTVHLATTVAVLWVYRRRVMELASGTLRGDAGSWSYVGLLALASVPAGLAGLLARDFFESLFERPLAAAAMLLVTGFLVWSVKYSAPGASRDRPGVGAAIWVGMAQAAAILPGISRSGATVAAGTWRGVTATRMAEFSFLLSIPAILGASLLEVEAARAEVAADGGAALGIGFIAALFAGVAAIRIFVSMLQHRTFHWFAVYCWLAGGTYLVAALFLPGLR